MKILNTVLGLTLIATLAGTLGCSTLRKSHQATLQGTWKGKEIGGRATGTCLLVIKENHMEFHGADPREWYKGTFVLNEATTPKQFVGTVTDCSAPNYVGKLVNAIYRIENGVLTLSGHEPGNPTMPTSFDGDQVRCFELRKD